MDPRRVWLITGASSGFGLAIAEPPSSGAIASSRPLAITLDGVAVDMLAAELGSNRNAVYKTLFDARRKLRPTNVLPTAADGLS
jgi:NAD(P)-dependent dehydrogenase (short-subunit alcohol dehydrogenase family)